MQLISIKCLECLDYTRIQLLLLLYNLYNYTFSLKIHKIKKEIPTIQVFDKL